VLSYQHADSYSRHVEAVQECLNVVVNLHPLPLPFVFQDSLRNSRHNTVVPSLNFLQSLCEACVVVV
jgi:hypothetical protein